MVTVAVKELSPSVALIVIRRGEGGMGCSGLSLKRNCSLLLPSRNSRTKSVALVTTGGSISNLIGVTLRMTSRAVLGSALRVTVPVARSPLRIVSGAMEKDASWPRSGGDGRRTIFVAMFPSVAEKLVRGALSISRENGQSAKNHDTPPGTVKGHGMTPARTGTDILPLSPVRAIPFPGISKHGGLGRRGGEARPPKRAA